MTMKWLVFRGTPGRLLGTVHGATRGDAWLTATALHGLSRPTRDGVLHLISQLAWDSMSAKDRRVFDGTFALEARAFCRGCGGIVPSKAKGRPPQWHDECAPWRIRVWRAYRQRNTRPTEEPL